MKHPIAFCICFLVLFLSFFEIDFFSSLYLKNENQLQDEIVLKDDFEKLQEQYQIALEKMDLWNDLENNRTMSKVILHDPYFFEEQITILKGKEEGITVNDIVYDENGYIGKVIEVKDHSSLVELITSHKTKIQVQVQNSFGILIQKENRLLVEKMTSKEKIEEGSIVYTSPYSEIKETFPIGKVTKITTNGIEQTLEIEPFLSINDLLYCVIRKSVTNE